MIASLMQDVRYALRQLRKSPGFALTAIAVLALGLGANAAVFTLLNGILLRPLPYVQADRVVAIDARGKFEGMNLSYANMLQLRDAMGSRFETGALFDRVDASVVGPGGRFQLVNVSVSAGLLKMLGVQPMLGRGFAENENDPGREHVVLLSEDAWRRVYRSNAGVVGNTLVLQGQLYTIIGVMPKGYSFPYGDSGQIWTPAKLDAASRTAMSGRNQAWGEFYARLPEGMTTAQLADRLTQTQQVVNKEVTEQILPTAIRVTVYRDWITQSVHKPLALLYCVVFGIWALACLNVTSLMLARAVARGRELAVRSALGASRGRLLQQSIVESLLLSSIGAVLGLLAGQVVLKLLWRRIEHSLPLTRAVHLEWRVVAALLGLTLLTAVMVGVFPALRAARRSVQSGLHGVNSTATASQNRTREVLVVGQLALTLVFLVGAGLFLRTIHALREVPLGFHQQNVLTGGISFHRDRRDVDDDGKGKVNFVQTTYLPLLERMQAIPGVKVAALSSVLPMRAEFNVGLATKIDDKETPGSDRPMVSGRLASAGLVDAMGIPMLRGRFFTNEDTLSSPVVVVINEAFVKANFQGLDPIGHTISLDDKGRFANARIVGVIGDVKQTSVIKGTDPELYYCLAQIEPGTPLYFVATAFMQVAIRGAVPADALRVQFEKALHDVSPDATTNDVKTIHEAVEDSFGSQTLTAYLLEGLAALALLIASVGLYGLLSFAVRQRTREFGLRIALGAQKDNILGLVLRRALLLVCMGLACGTVLAWFAVSLAQSYIFGVQMHDAATFATVVGVLAAASLLAAWLPASYAASIEPIQALRTE